MSSDTLPDEDAATFTYEDAMVSIDRGGTLNEVLANVELLVSAVVDCITLARFEDLVNKYAQPTWKANANLKPTVDMLRTLYTKALEVKGVVTTRVRAKTPITVARKIYEAEAKLWVSKPGTSKRGRILVRFICVYEGDAWYVNPRSLLRIKRI